MTPEPTATSVGVVVGTYKSEKFIAKNIDCLLRQTVLPAHLIIVDSGSPSQGYVNAAGEQARRLIAAVDIVLEDNIGFSAGYNLGYKRLQDTCQYVLFLNADVFLSQDALARLLALLTGGDKIGATTGLLLGYDIDQDIPTGLIDSAGIFRTWYGRWYDRYQGRRLNEVGLGTCRPVPAVCGALMLCRREALQEVALPGGHIFDPDLWMYKEDIDLSLRLRERGWGLVFDPGVQSFHCRGWQPREKMPQRLRLMSARNEIKVCLKNRDPRVLYSLVKYFYVKWFE